MKKYSVLNRIELGAPLLVVMSAQQAQYAATLGVVMIGGIVNIRGRIKGIYETRRNLQITGTLTKRKFRLV